VNREAFALDAGRHTHSAVNIDHFVATIRNARAAGKENPDPIRVRGPDPCGDPEAGPTGESRNNKNRHRWAK